MIAIQTSHNKIDEAFPRPGEYVTQITKELQRKDGGIESRLLFLTFWGDVWNTLWESRWLEKYEL